MGWVPAIVELERTLEPLTYSTTNDSWPAGTKAAADLLDRLGIPLDHGKAKARAAIKAAKENAPRNDVLMAALRYRRSGLVQVAEVGS